MKKDLKKMIHELQEISGVVNSFNSEAVQLKLVDLLMKDITDDKIAEEKVDKIKEKPVIIAVKPTTGKIVKATNKQTELPIINKNADAIKPVKVEKKIKDSKPAKIKSEKKAAVKIDPAVKISEPKITKNKVAKSDSKAAVKLAKDKESTKVKKAITKIAPKIKEVKKSGTKRKMGATKTIQTLISDGYFNDKRSIHDLVQHCKSAFKLTFKVTDLSGIMNRFVKENKLNRDKSAKSHRFEYFNIAQLN